MASRRRPWIANRRTALWLGYGGLLLGAVAMYDAYENRGRQRPFASKFLPS
jgi:hypothetical protein